jgi:hypothetical protein
MRDLGLSYEEAAHGVQSAIKFEMTKNGIDADGPIASMIKHLRVGVDMRAADMRGLVELLIRKGIVTDAEYDELARLGANEELAEYEDILRRKYDLPQKASFRREESK